MTIVGIREVDFTSRDGKQVKGVTLYTEEEKNGVRGVATDRVFIPARLNIFASDFEVGENIEVQYNKYGSLQNIVKA